MRPSSFPSGNFAHLSSREKAQESVRRSPSALCAEWPERCPSDYSDAEVMQVQSSDIENNTPTPFKPKWKRTPRWPLEKPPGVRRRGRRLDVMMNGRWRRYTPVPVKPKWKKTPRWPLEKPPGVRKRGKRLEVKVNGSWRRYTGCRP